MSKAFWGVIVAIILILGGIFLLNHHNPTSSGSKSSGNTLPTEHIEGNGKAGVTLVEYGDYECPYCEEYYPIVQQVVSNNFNNIYFQFRNFPLTSIHPNAFAGARAAEAAGLMGKFWQMHDALYNSSNWQQWSTSSNPIPYFDQYAKQLGLNLSTFTKYYNSNRVNNLIVADMQVGNNLGINGTPTFYLDGKQIQVGPTVADFQKLIDSAIKSKSGQPQAANSGTTSQTQK